MEIKGKSMDFMMKRDKGGRYEASKEGISK